MVSDFEPKFLQQCELGPRRASSMLNDGAYSKLSSSSLGFKFAAEKASRAGA
jgi:hypothetical protein